MERMWIYSFKFWSIDTILNFFTSVFPFSWLRIRIRTFSKRETRDRQFETVSWIRSKSTRKCLVIHISWNSRACFQYAWTYQVQSWKSNPFLNQEISARKEGMLTRITFKSHHSTPSSELSNVGDSVCLTLYPKLYVQLRFWCFCRMFIKILETMTLHQTDTRKLNC